MELFFILLGSIVVGLFRYSIQSPRKRIEERIEEMEEEESIKEKLSNYYRYCILVLLAEVMKADSRLMSCELDKVKATIRRYYKTETEQKTAHKQFQTILAHYNNLEARCSSINKRLNYIAKSELIMELLAVAYADDHFDTTEESIIQKIVKISTSRHKNIKVSTCFS